MSRKNRMREVGITLANCEVSKDVAHHHGITKKEADAIAYGIYVGIGLYGANVKGGDVALMTLVDAMDHYAEHKEAYKPLILDTDDE